MNAPAAPLPPEKRPPPRPDIDVEIDRAWHAAKFTDDLEAKASHWRRHNALVAERAAQQEVAA